MGRLVATLLLLGVAAPAAARWRVCTLAFNGPEEVDAFRAHLPPEDFEIVDLSPALAPAPTDATTAPPATRLRAELVRRGLGHVEIEVDGGVSPENIRALADAGMTIAVAGTSAFDPRAPVATNVRALRAACRLHANA